MTPAKQSMIARMAVNVADSHVTTDTDRCRAAQNLQQATYALIVAISSPSDRDRRTSAAIGYLRTACRDLGFDLVAPNGGSHREPGDLHFDGAS